MARKSRKQIDSEIISVTQSSGNIFNAGLYARISVENEHKRFSDSIGNQIQLLKDFVSEQSDIQTFDIYSDDDISGTDFIRPEFSRLMNDVRDGRVNCIIVKDLSRLGRNFLESGEYIELVFPFLGVRFISITDRFDTKYQQVDLSVQIKNMANEMYAKDTSLKICSTMQSIQEQGKFAGSRAPYGYLIHPHDKHQLIIDEVTAPVVQEIFEMVAAGNTLHYIATDLNKRKVPSPGRRMYDLNNAVSDKFKNSVWYMPTIRRILLNRVYLGWMVSRRYKSDFYLTGKKGSKPVPEEDWIITKATHEPIITEYLFNKAQEYLASTKEQHALIAKTNSKSKQDNIFKGHLRCGECGRNMQFRKKNGHGKISWWYFCPLHEHYNSALCVKKAVKQEDLESLAFTLIQNQIKLFLDAQALITQLNKKETSKTRYHVYTEQTKNVQQQIERYMQLKASLYEDFAEGIITEDDYMTMGQDYAGKADELRIFLSELQKESQKYSPDYVGSHRWEHLVTSFRDCKKIDANMIDAFIDTLTLFNDGHVEIIFKYKDEIESVLLYASIRRKEMERYAG